jgi:SAM-dependent methyltransferase
MEPIEMCPERLDYDPHARAYAASRTVHPGVLASIQQAADELGARRVLEIGVGTGNVLFSLNGPFERLGIDPSRGMLQRAATRPGLELAQGRAERLPFPDGSIDLAYSVDVIHHVVDRAAAARELFRILRPGGKVLIATDSAEDIAARIPLSSYFPETVAVELRRYPAIETIEAELSAAGFAVEPALHVSRRYPLTDISGYETKSYSSLLLISDEAHQRGLCHMRSDLERGPIEALSLYTIVVAVRPAKAFRTVTPGSGVGWTTKG